jgi:hypothetical protein
MAKPISEYTLADWKRLRPLIHALKSARYRRVMQRYVSQPAAAGDAASIVRIIAGRDVLVTVAFNDPQAAGWQALLLRHYVPQALHVIVDNSSDRAAAATIADVARRYGVYYVQLPDNPWRGSSRSHGIAMNWAWRNILLPGRPRVFGFIDDDLFPTAPDDPFAALAVQDFFGVMRWVEPRWFLWAGFCMFKFTAVQAKPLDFGQDWFAGLDTGGGNWDVLYRYADRQLLRAAPTSFVPYKPGIDISEGPMQWCGAWLHEIGSTGNAALEADKRRVIAEILYPHLQAADRAQTAPETFPAFNANPAFNAKPAI